MKKFINTYPNLYTYILAILLFGCALFISAFINKGIAKEYFPYTAVILLTIATWFLYKRKGYTLDKIGLNFKVRNWLLIPLGVIIGAGVFLFAKYVRAIYLGETFNLSYTFNYNTILFVLYIILPTVAVEEFLFRGYLFKKTIELTSVTKANIIFSLLFMSIHVLDSQVLKNPGMIILLVISIPVGHLMYATALLKSKSILFPIGIHLGNNWATRHLVSTTNNSDSIFYITDNVSFDTWPSFIAFVLLWNSIFLIATFIIWKWDLTWFKNQFKKE
jgi:membrane protease YdiL (CAAX protease family)